MENQQQQTTSLCRGGCGFFGAAATEGLCSKCFKDQIKRQQDAARITPSLAVASMSSSEPAEQPPVPIESPVPVVAPPTSSAAPSSTLSCSQEALSSEGATAALEAADAATGGALLSSANSVSLELASPPAGDAESSTALPLPKKANRCQQCNKRVGLTGFNCRCGGLFCSEHRYDTAHSCSFDYKTMEREELRKNNPVIVSDKIQRI